MRILDLSGRRAAMVEEWRDWTPKIVKAVESILADFQVYVFGSVVRGDHTGGSDVDILIVSNSVPERLRDKARIRAMIEDEAKLPAFHPFEIHITTPEEAKTYFSRAGGDIIQIR